MKRIRIKEPAGNPTCQSTYDFWTCTEHLDVEGMVFHVATHSWDCSENSLLGVWDDNGRSYRPKFDKNSFSEVVAYIQREWLPLDPEVVAVKAASLSQFIEEVEKLR